MRQLLELSKLIDRCNDGLAWFSKWAIFFSFMICAGNAVIRYSGIMNSSNGWSEIQWYLLTAAVMLGAAQVLRVNEHVRVDIFYGMLSNRGKVFLDLFGLIVFLLPVMGFLFYSSWPLFLKWYQSGQMSENAGGLIRWPVMLMLPAGFLMLSLQGLSEIIKRIAWLMNLIDMDTHYERPLQ